MKKILTLLLLITFIFPTLAQAQDVGDKLFEATVLKVVGEEKITREDGSEGSQQKVLIKGLEGEWKGQEIEVQGLNGIDVFRNIEAAEGDRVLITESQTPDGEKLYFISDYVRRAPLYLLAIIFCALIIIIGKKKGLKALLSLILSFVVIMWFILPRILAGDNPLFISIIGALIILGLVVYVTWGWKAKAHIASISMVISLFITGVVSIVFTNISNLTGLAQDDAVYLIGAGEAAINFQGLLLAGIIIGTLGVLDDVIISQISTVEQIKKTGKDLSFSEVYKKALSVGVDHISSMTNTLFLAYAGAALPLLLLFVSNTEQSVTFGQVLNNEIIATEIVRTLTGSIGLILAMPIATVLAAKYLKVK